ncbi:MAG: tetratricopeptide repeat protein, partial [Myxococcales bacterium]|nr:tetratricopeptide repeat protein [Myxococcales bacterium]
MNQADLEQQALEQLRRGDLRAAHQTLAVLLRHRPADVALRRRIQQVESLIRQREETQARIQAEPLRYAHAYIQAGRLAEGLQLLRAALARDPNNERLRTLALQVARKLREQVPAEAPAQAVDPEAQRRAAERARREAEAEAEARRQV